MSVYVQCFLVLCRCTQSTLFFRFLTIVDIFDGFYCLKAYYQGSIGVCVKVSQYIDRAFQYLLNVVCFLSIRFLELFLHIITITILLNSYCYFINILLVLLPCFQYFIFEISDNSKGMEYSLMLDSIFLLRWFLLGIFSYSFLVLAQHFTNMGRILLENFLLLFDGV